MAHLLLLVPATPLHTTAAVSGCPMGEKGEVPKLLLPAPVGVCAELSSDRDRGSSGQVLSSPCLVPLSFSLPAQEKTRGKGTHLLSPLSLADPVTCAAWLEWVRSRSEALPPTSRTAGDSDLQGREEGREWEGMYC